MAEGSSSPLMPDDFDDFWAEAVSEVKQFKPEIQRSITNDFDSPGFIVNSLSFSALGGRRLNGWIAYPEGARRRPAFLWTPPYGRESVLPNAYGTRDGFTSLSFNFHGESSFHREAYVPARGYFSVGAEDPESFIFRQMFQDAYVAARVLQSQIEVDEDRVAAMGMSQGAGISIWLAAQCPIIKAVCADMPFLANIAQTLTQSIYRYPLKELSDYMDQIPLGHERVLSTLPYFDTINHATRCDKPTLVSLGLKDPAVRPANARAVYEALPAEKLLVTYDWGHDWHPHMIHQNRAWLSRHLA